MTSPPSQLPCIPSNPDVAGVGVRFSVYFQAFLSFVAPVLAMTDGIITLEEKERNTVLPIENLLLSASLAFTAFSQIHTLSVYHAVIISIMGWILEGPLILTSCSTAFRASDFVSYEMSVSRIIHGILGILLWSKIDTFGGELSTCTTSTYFVVLGHEIPVLNDTLRSASILFHSARMLEGMVALFLNPFLWQWTTRGSRPIRINRRIAAGRLASAFMILSIQMANIEVMIARSRKALVSSGENTWGFGQIVAIFLIFTKLREVSLAVRSWVSSRKKSKERRLSGGHELEDAATSSRNLSRTRKSSPRRLPSIRSHTPTLKQRAPPQKKNDDVGDDQDSTHIVKASMLQQHSSDETLTFSSAILNSQLGVRTAIFWGA
ncbi:hypothetical protein BDZ97DRAFT_1920663 [Flammula alnicola]|nr:hypothetical protein BDZ97DRAFT_1920663 [Flammula alnicola]